jgi:hypothetical protein
MAELDPRWEWIEVGDFGKAGPSYIRGRCNHLEVVPVTLVLTGEQVAQLCLTCGGQLPPGPGAGPPGGVPLSWPA